MEWNDIVTIIRFRPNPLGESLSSDEENFVRLDLHYLFHFSETARFFISDLASRQLLNFSKYPANSSGGGGQGDGVVFMDYSRVSSIHHLNLNGSVVTEQSYLLLMHEMMHQYGYLDPVDDNNRPLNSRQNNPEFDLRGRPTNIANLVAQELGVPQYQRASYVTSWTPNNPDYSYFTVGRSFTGGEAIDNVRVPDNGVFGINDVISMRGASSDVIILGTQY